MDCQTAAHSTATLSPSTCTTANTPRSVTPTLCGRCATKQPRGSSWLQSGCAAPGLGLTALGTRYRGESAQWGLMRYSRTRVGGRCRRFCKCGGLMGIHEERKSM